MGLWGFDGDLLERSLSFMRGSLCEEGVELRGDLLENGGELVAFVRSEAGEDEIGVV